MSLSNYGSISHRLGAMDVESFRHVGQRTDNGRTDGRTDNGRTDRHALSIKGNAARGVALKTSVLPVALPQKCRDGGNLFFCKLFLFSVFAVFFWNFMILKVNFKAI